MKKFIFFSLLIICSEYEFYDNKVEVIDVDKDIDEFTRDVAKNYYVGGTSTEDEEDVFYYFGGEVSVTVTYSKEITKEEFDVLGRFL